MQYEPYKAMDLSEVRIEPAERMESVKMIAVELKTTGKLIGNLYACLRDDWMTDGKNQPN